MDGNFFDIVLVKWDQAPFTEGSNTERPELNDAAYNTGNAMAESKSFGSELLNGVGGDGDIKVPFTRYSPEKIFSGAVPAFDVNFIDPKDWSETLTDTEKQEIKDAQEVIDNEDSTDEEKADMADDFAEKYEGKVEDFVEFISQEDLIAPGTFKQTWRFIEKEKHSLERFTNMHLMFK